MYPQSMFKISFFTEILQLLQLINLCILHGHVFVMGELKLFRRTEVSNSGPLAPTSDNLPLPRFPDYAKTSV